MFSVYVRSLAALALLPALISAQTSAVIPAVIIDPIPTPISPIVCPYYVNCCRTIGPVSLLSTSEVSEVTIDDPTASVGIACPLLTSTEICWVNYTQCDQRPKPFQHFHTMEVWRSLKAALFINEEALGTERRSLRILLVLLHLSQEGIGEGRSEAVQSSLAARNWPGICIPGSLIYKTFNRPRSSMKDRAAHAGYELSWNKLLLWPLVCENRGDVLLFWRRLHSPSVD
ncbi:hypothetical protein JAAARDRAFT_76463 [Jaapia argillacea MUCL 33604]|uniref:Hydrophobin n=1 Tax=Jaapia argillacea MUCL 33604 TaxID=933084 RepID=A0A067QGY5_9AGAM|nr:hypothetical protein JAAARDRAFT_76463 [Jaapia argillacea MUCL 33604]